MSSRFRFRSGQLFHRVPLPACPAVLLLGYHLALPVLNALIRSSDAEFKVPNSFVRQLFL